MKETDFLNSLPEELMAKDPKATLAGYKVEKKSGATYSFGGTKEERE